MILVFVACALVLVAVAAAWTLIRPSDWALKRMARLSSGTLFRIETQERVIALTIDDAPHLDVTPGLLRELQAHNARATFFIIGAYGAAHPELIDSIRADGHELANHLYTDRLSARLTDWEFRDELMRTEALIQPLGSPRWCRPGCGIITPRIARLMRERGYTPVAGTAYPVDLRANMSMTLKHFIKNVRPGAILVLHDGGPARSRNIDVLAAVLPRVRRMGYRVTTLGELSRLPTREP